MLLSRFLVPCLFACCVVNARADQILEGFTVLKGDGYAFELKAPLGWVLDDKAGNDQGLNVVFYPEHASWDKSDAVCFARVRSLDSHMTNIEEQVKETVKAFHDLYKKNQAEFPPEASQAHAGNPGRGVEWFCGGRCQRGPR